MKGVMKGSILFLFFSMIHVIGFGQAPDLISYQAIIRNSNNELVSNVSVGTRISILRGSAADVLLYQEEHNVKTNLNGLIYLNIGSGAPLVGTMSGIDWSKGPFYVKSETDPTGGKNYTLVVVSQLLSVPFSIYAKSAEKVTGPLTELDPLFNASISKGITAVDTAYWNKKLSSFMESDPLFSASVAKGITAADTALWNSESDPLFSVSISNGITAVDTAYWNKKLSSFTESDPIFNASIAKGITAADTALWNSESDPIFNASIAKGITAADTALWNTESDPLFNASIAKGITAVDTASWNQKVGLPQTGNNAGDILFWNGTAWVKIQQGLPGQGLFLSQTGIPVWAGPAYATLTTTAATSVTNMTAVSGGNITSDGGTPVTARGICWSTSPNPTVTNSTTSNGAGTGIFSSNISDLLGSTTYYVRAYAINTTGVSYGNQITFTTPVPTPPSLTTTAASSITSVSVETGGTILNNGGAPITARGVVWDTLTNPLITKNKSINGSINNIFLDTIRGLAGSSVYYVRSYATNSAGTAYGNEVSFTTLTPVVPTVTINPIDLITNVSARSGGAITSDGGAAILNKGVVWSTFVNPTISNSKTTDSSGLAPFISQLTGLLGDSVYYVRAYATNATGTGYSSQLNFTAAAAVLATVVTKPVTAITSTSATSGGTITLTGGAPHSEKGVVYGTATNPTISNTKLIDNTVGLDWVSNITGLTGNTKYYVRAYATNVIGTAYGVLDSFTTSPIIPTLTTTIITAVTQISSVSGGNISSDGGSAITARGIVWSKTVNPVLGTPSTSTDGGITTGAFTSNITNISSGITYYVRAYATNAVGTAYGSQQIFTSLPIIDSSNNQYTTININGLEWFRENLKTSKYANGVVIENVPTAGDWGLRTTGAWVYYDNDVNNDIIYGKLYNWYAVSDVRGLCPTGSRVATDADWTSLTALYGNDAAAGNELKVTTLWKIPNSNTNLSGFGAVPGGGRGGLNFGDLNNKGFWWTSTPFDASSSYVRRLEFDLDTVTRFAENDKFGFSVRCVKD